MKRILIITILFNLFHPISGSTLFHEQPFEARIGEDLVLDVIPITDIDILEAKGYYRIKGNLSYQELTLVQTGPNWRMQINGSLLSEKGIEYCFVFNLANGAILAAPEVENPFDQPFFIAVKPKKSNGQEKVIEKPVFNESIYADVLILSPDPGSEIDKRDIIIAASLFNVSNVDSSSIRLRVNGNDVTKKAEISGGIIAYTPEKMATGKQTVEITLSTLDGKNITPVRWSFNVRKGSIIPSQFKYDGAMTTKISSDLVGDQFLNIAEFNVKARVEVEYANIRINYRNTSRENPYKQPLNRSSFNVNFMKYLNVKFGDFYESINPYTLDGRRVRGVSVDLDLRFFRVQVIRGQLNRPVQRLNKIDGGYSLLGNKTTIDSLVRPIFTLDRKGYTFERELALTRFSLNLFNYRFGVYFMKAIDDINSVDQFISGAIFFVDSADVTYNDSLYNIPIGKYSYDEFLTAVEKVNGTILFPTKHWNGYKPHDNIVVGLDFGRVMDKNRMKFDFSWNMSLFNRDIWDGVMTRAQLDTALDDSLDGLIATMYDDDGKITEGSLNIDTMSILNPSDYEQIFIMNINMLPLLPIDPVSFETNPISTIINMPSSAFHFRLSGNYRYNKFTIQYRQIGPEFVSLANPYLTNNVREFTISDRLSLLDNKLMLNVMYRYQDDKILATVKEPLKTKNLSFGITFIPGPNTPSYVINFQSIGKNNSQDEFERVGDELVDFREDSKTINTFFSITYPFSTGRLKHNLNLNVNSLSNEDMLAGDRLKGYFFQKSDSKTISTALSTKYTLPLRSVFNVSRTAIQVPIQNDDGSITFNELSWTSVNTKGSYSFWNNRLKVTGGLSYLSNKGTTPITLFGFNSGVEINILNGMKAFLTGHMQMRRTEKETGLNTSGVLFSLRYNF